MAKKKEAVIDETASLAIALKELCDTKGLSKDVVIDAMSEALKKAYFKYSGDYSDSIIRVDINLDTGAIYMAKCRNVVEEIQDDVFETDPEEIYEETGIHYNVGDIVETPIDISLFKRNAAIQAKMVFKQKLREAEKAVVTEQFQDKIGDIVSGTVEVVEDKHCIIKIGHTSAYLPISNMLPNEKLRLGQQIMVYVSSVEKKPSGTPIVVSRVHPHFITRLMENDISEIYDGTVEIKGISRDPGVRSKVAVYSKDPNIDPSGACIGVHGQRINRVLSQINGEKIDVVNFNENPLLFVADALKPAQIVGMHMINEEEKTCRAIVADDQYSLAIGKGAQNVNLAVRLTGWKIDIKSVTDAEAEGYEYETVEDIKLKDQAMKSKASRQAAANTVVASQQEENNFVLDDEDDYSTVVTTNNFTTPVEEVGEVESTPVIEEVVAEEKEEVITPTPTKKSKNPNVFSALEAALSGQSNETKEAPTKKKWTKKTEKKEEDEEVKTKPVTPTNVLPVYTEEELKALEAEEAEEEDFDEEVDYDEFDDYYDNN